MLLASAVVVWEWLNEHGHWRPYSPAVSHHIEAVVRAGPRTGGSVVLGQVDSRLAPYIIDLQSMNQFRQDTVPERILEQGPPRGSGLISYCFEFGTHVLRTSAQKLPRNWINAPLSSDTRRASCISSRRLWRPKEETALQDKEAAKMLHLQSSQMLQMLEKSLRKHLPESLKVYGTVFHMNQGNPFKLKALVDKWPDFNTVIVRPQEQEMTDDFDPHVNTYQIYSKDPKNCLECLGTPEAINWKQHLQVQSSQSSLNEAIMGITAAKLVKVKRTQCILYIMPQTAKKLVPFLMEDTENLHHPSGRLRAINHEMFKLSSLDVTHAALVDKFWHFGGNERSQRFIERCIQTFPSSCLLGPEGTPVSWALMDQTGEMRMAGTVPDYRAQGLISHIIHTQTLVMEERGYPVYNHMDRANKLMQKMSHTLQHVPMPCDWNQWNCVPL